MDGRDQGWFLTGDGTYTAGYDSRRRLPTLTYEQLLAERGPLRPVVAVPDADEQTVHRVLTTAGTKAAGSILVALYRLFRRYADRRQLLLAGREGSWESAGLPWLAWEVGSRIAERPTRFDESTVQTLVAVIDSWVSDRERFVEVAGNLAAVFGSVADAAGGWPAVADKFSAAGGRFSQNEQEIEAVRDYLLSTSQWYWEQRSAASDLPRQP